MDAFLLLSGSQIDEILESIVTNLGCRYQATNALAHTLDVFCEHLQACVIEQATLLCKRIQECNTAWNDITPSWPFSIVVTSRAYTNDTGNAWLTDGFLSELASGRIEGLPADFIIQIAFFPDCTRACFKATLCWRGSGTEVVWPATDQMVTCALMLAFKGKIVMPIEAVAAATLVECNSPTTRVIAWYALAAGGVWGTHLPTAKKRFQRPKQQLWLGVHLQPMCKATAAELRTKYPSVAAITEQSACTGLDRCQTAQTEGEVLLSKLLDAHISCSMSTPAAVLKTPVWQEPDQYPANMDRAQSEWVATAVNRMSFLP